MRPDTTSSLHIQAAKDLVNKSNSGEIKLTVDGEMVPVDEGVLNPDSVPAVVIADGESLQLRSEAQNVVFSSPSEPCAQHMHTYTHTQTHTHNNNNNNNTHTHAHVHIRTAVNEGKTKWNKALYLSLGFGLGIGLLLVLAFAGLMVCITYRYRR